jgi:hypothetical protein
VLAAKDNVWPCIPRSGSGAAGPTSSPWIDSNGWFLRLATVLAPGKQVWLEFSPPAAPNLIRTEAYLRAVADAGSFGGQWIVSLDEMLRAGLAAGNPAAVERWRAIASAVSFFEKQREWRGFQSLGTVGVLSSFTGADEMLGHETLNLLARRNLPYRILEISKAEAASFGGFNALICMDEQLPPPGLRRKLLAFAEQGGALMLSHAWKGEGGTPTGQEHPRIELRTLGRGRIAVAKTDSPDPYMVARDTHVLVSKANDLLRFYNIESLISHYSIAPDRSKAVIQMTNYAMRFPEDLVTVWFREKYRAARLRSIGSDAAVPLELYSENNGIDVKFPSTPVYNAAELFFKA